MTNFLKKVEDFVNLRANPNKINNRFPPDLYDAHRIQNGLRGTTKRIIDPTLKVEIDREKQSIKATISEDREEMSSLIVECAFQVTTDHATKKITGVEVIVDAVVDEEWFFADRFKTTLRYDTYGKINSAKVEIYVPNYSKPDKPKILSQWELSSGFDFGTTNKFADITLTYVAGDRKKETPSTLLIAGDRGYAKMHALEFPLEIISPRQLSEIIGTLVKETMRMEGIWNLD